MENDRKVKERVSRSSNHSSWALFRPLGYCLKYILCFEAFDKLRISEIQNNRLSPEDYVVVSKCLNRSGPMHVILVLAIKTDLYTFPVQHNKCKKRTVHVMFFIELKKYVRALYYFVRQCVCILPKGNIFEGQTNRKRHDTTTIMVSSKANSLLKSSLKPIQMLKEMEETK